MLPDPVEMLLLYALAGLLVGIVVGIAYMRHTYAYEMRKTYRDGRRQGQRDVQRYMKRMAIDAPTPLRENKWSWVYAAQRRMYKIVSDDFDLLTLQEGEKILERYEYPWD